MNYLILSHKKPTYDKTLALWWAPKSNGYTVNVNEAGRYGQREAESICANGTATMIPVPEAKAKTRMVVVFGDLPQAHGIRR